MSHHLDQQKDHHLEKMVVLELLNIVPPLELLQKKTDKIDRGVIFQ